MFQLSCHHSYVFGFLSDQVMLLIRIGSKVEELFTAARSMNILLVSLTDHSLKPGETLVKCRLPFGRFHPFGHLVHLLGFLRNICAITLGNNVSAIRTIPFHRQ